MVSLIQGRDTGAISGFVATGAAKAVPKMRVDKHVREPPLQGRSFRTPVLSGLSCSSYIDNDLAGSQGISWRAPYLAGKVLQDQIN